MSPTTGPADDHRGFRVLAKIPVMLRTAAAVLLPVIAACACGTGVPSGSSAQPSPSAAPPPSASSAQPSPSAAPPQPSAAKTAGGCQDTFVPSYFYSSTSWTQAIDTRPAPGVMLLNVDNGVGTAPLSHFQTLVTRAQAAGITVLGYSSTVNGQRPIGSVETEVSEYRAWYGVNGIFLDLTQGTASELSYYRQLAGYIRATVPNAVVWLNPGTYPDQSFMSIANVVLVFEGSCASYLQDQVPGWVRRYQPGQFAHVIYATPGSDLASAVNLSRARRAGHLFVTDLPGSPNPYGAMPSYWAQEAAAIPANC